MRPVVSIWVVDLIGEICSEEMLTPDELDRARSFRFFEDRRRFVTGRCALKNILAGFLEKTPGEIQFQYGLNGKPKLRGDPIHFNLSRSKDLAVIAVSRNGPLGIDLEHVMAGIALEIAQHVCSSHEMAWLSAISNPAERDRAFCKLWTYKEAWLKATGLGLMGSISCCSAELSPRGKKLNVDGGVPSNYSVRTINVGKEDFVCALATYGTTPAIYIREGWTPRLQQWAGNPT